MPCKATFVLAVAVIFSLACLLSAGCHSSELSRGKAKDILDKVGSERSYSQITMSMDQLQRLNNIADRKLVSTTLTKHFVVSSRVPWKLCVPDKSDVRVITGQFLECPSPANPEVTWQHPGMVVPLRTPIKQIVIEVTGIADGSTPSEKTVEYTWRFDFSSMFLPKAIEDALTFPLRTGKAAFRRYDDGWRFMNFI